MKRELPHPAHPTTYLQADVLGELVDIQWYPTKAMGDAYGLCDTEEREIRIRDNLNGLKCLDTLQHELLHYISDITNIDLSEHQVHVLGMALAHFYLTNPLWLVFVKQRIEEEHGRRIKTV